MKIFNWIHRHRSPYNVHHSEVSMVEDGASARRSAGSSSIRKDDKEPLLEEEESTKGDWELDRILTIGTLAMDPLKFNAAANLQDEEGDNGDNHTNDHHDMNSTMILVKEDVVDVPNHELEVRKVHVHDDPTTNNVVKRSSNCNEIEEVEDEELMAYEKLSKRVTLLDLFLADASHLSVVAEKEKLQLEHDDHYTYVEEDGTDDKAAAAKDIKTKKKEKLLLYKKLASALGGKKGFSSKLIHQGDHAHAHAPPLKKLQRFMTRMMKKKIHPGDMEEAARLQKKGDVELLEDDDDLPMGIDITHTCSPKHGNAATESVFLLPTQGTMV